MGNKTIDKILDDAFYEENYVGARKRATKAINAYYLAEVLDMIGDDLVHMHLIRIYDEGCQVRDITNGIKAVFRKATKERFK